MDDRLTVSTTVRFSNKQPKITMQEIYDTFFNADLLDIEQRIMHNTRGTSKSNMSRYYGTSLTSCIMDDQCETRLDLEPADDTGPKKMYWTQPIPTADPFNKPVSDPSVAKRAKLRAKRKKR